MSRGCIWTLVGVGVALLVLIVLAVAIPLIYFDIVTSAPRVPVTSFVNPNTVIAIGLDPNRSGIAGMIAEGAREDPSAIEYMLPHEVGLTIDVDPTQSTRTMTFICSARHFGPVFTMLFGSREAVAGAEADGIDQWVTEGLVEEDGALVLRGQGAIEESARSFVQSNWSQDGSRQPATLDGDHFLELSIVNRDGSAVLAFPNDDLASALEKDPPPVERSSPESAAEPEPTVAAESDGPVMNPIDVVLDILSLHLTADYTEPDLFTVSVTAMSPDPEAAVRAQRALTNIADSMVAEYEQDGVALDGEFVARESRITGALQLTGVRPLVVRSIRQEMR